MQGVAALRTASSSLFRSRILPGLFAAGCVVLAVTASAGQAPDPLRVYGNTSVIELTPVLLAAQSHGEPVTVSNGGVPDLFRPDRAQVSTNAETQALRVSVDNPDVRIIMTVAEGLYRVVARRSAGISKLADLKGKRIATVPVTSAGYFLHRMLREAGLDYADVTVVTNANMQQVSDQLVAGQLDAVTFWEPEIDNILLRLGADAIEFSGKGVYREVFNLNTTATQLADPVQRRRIVEFVRSILKATRSLHADPRAGWAAMAKSSGFDADTIARTWHHHRYLGEIVPDLLDVLEDEEKFLAREARRPARPRATLATLIDPSVLEEALAGHPELRITPPSPEQVLRQAERLRATPPRGNP
jgi:NitT/TauT family transport system substrate-binding protein